MTQRRKLFGDIWYTEIERGHWRKSIIQYGGQGYLYRVNEDGSIDQSDPIPISFDSIPTLTVTEE